MKPNGEGLRKSILSGPYVPSTVLVQAVAATEGNPAIQQHTTIETILNMTLENKEHFLSEKEAIFLLLTGIGDDIYSIVDACKTANEMWIAIERIQQGESFNVQDVKTNLFWEFGKFTSQDGESMESYYSRFYKLMNELTRNNLQVTTMQQYQNEVNDIRAERIAKSANPLALLTAAQPYSDNYYQAQKPQRTYATSSSTRRSSSTRHKGKEFAKLVTPQSELVSEEDSDPEQAQRDTDMQKNLALLAKYFKKLYKPTNNNLRTSTNSRNKTEDTTPRYSRNHQNFSTLQQIPTFIPKTMLRRHYCGQPESINDTYVLKKDDSNVTPDSSNICTNDNQVDQNAAECVDERAALANLIANLTLDTEENKTILKQLKKANASLTQELEIAKLT
ncbi:hypothetical protein Tco_1493702 [Tanacetum coccineum]